MCGLIAIWSKKGKPVGQQVIKLYKKQDHRGKAGYGYLAIDDKGMLLGIKRSKDEATMLDYLKEEQASNILFHHRFPTSTENTLNTTHPMRVSHAELEFDYILMHNGKIHNQHTMNVAHGKLGYKYKSEYEVQTINVHTDGKEEVVSVRAGKFNDSECLAIEMARHLDDKLDKLETTGPIAFIAVRLLKGTDQVVSTYYGRNQGRPLTTVKTRKYHGLASEHGDSISAMKIYSYDIGDPQLYQQDFPVDEAMDVKPVVRTTYTPERQELIRQDYASLENRYYTYSEAYAKTIPMNAFESVNIDKVMYYVPKKYLKYQDERQPLDSKRLCPEEPPKQNFMGFGQRQNEQDELDAQEKVRGILEDLCTKHAKLSTQRDILSNSHDIGMLLEKNYSNKDNELIAEQHTIEESISKLNCSPDDVVEMLELCEAMEDFNNTYANANRYES